MTMVWPVPERGKGLGKSESREPPSVGLGNDSGHVDFWSPSSCDENLMSDR